ncbi:Glu/Leu/Phe/Val dehydrogenase dimerization domain-containing protein [Listeria booriae]|uniref:Glu/Leu/Phe/Val dehydrogenase n=1 Tax=Listeria booriae TaxID=1552123 RepID=A0A099W520_9LIST|nr:Glu/Leu/Phe/Val dehydrogenase dimerization domain-containing protein [Listeria booriae]KGL40859.1 leucine dehydrogenase [Listeria booriae]MBC1356990.1 Glu/Leu/Phe/Val dehydrogenase [Listeria booriae]MBC1371767.1 Glu/Leu/Phe/Val dehydrogenase [Listeria booriae]MBC1552384.1 Glu/Leu/Phe/Val dehydrogenase [Listeria booriae]MBC1560833.1 Glu/Leu/Phe/Val dehydrogenase [Listeria booriae]
MLFERMEKYDYEQVVFCHDKVSGLKAIIAIHDTTLGPALGGCRMWPYETEEEALEDVLRLARGMTYKNAAAGLNLGGGKTVIIGDPRKDKSEAMFRALGRYVESLNGRYIIAEDVGTTVADMDMIHAETDYVTGISESYGSSGNPSPMTALGVYSAMKRTALEAFGTDTLAEKTVAVQGVGNVAYALCELLHKDGAKLVVTDINQEAVNRAVAAFGAKAVAPDEIYDVDADIFAPCALGGVLNDTTIPRLKVKAVCGSSNNQLLQTIHHGQMLADRGILYAPDYIVNAGGVINVADELSRYNEERAKHKIGEIYGQIGKVFDIAKEEKILPAQAANRMAEQRMESMRHVSSTFLRAEHSLLTRR